MIKKKKKGFSWWKSCFRIKRLLEVGDVPRMSPFTPMGSLQLLLHGQASSGKI